LIVIAASVPTLALRNNPFVDELATKRYGLFLSLSKKDSPSWPDRPFPAGLDGTRVPGKWVSRITPRPSGWLSPTSTSILETCLNSVAGLRIIGSPAERAGVVSFVLDEFRAEDVGVAVLNTKERVTLEKALEQSLKPLALDDVLRLKSEGAQLVDVRDAAYFEAGHLRDNLNIGLSGQYATWAGTLLDLERPIVVITDPGREYEAEMRLGRIGFDRVAGHLEGGMQALASRPDLPELIARTERISPEELAEELARPADASGPVFVLDVRAAQEWKQSRIEGSENVPLNRLRTRLGDVPRDRRVVVHCASGYRSAIAVSLLKHCRYQDVADLAGGIKAWLIAVPERPVGTVSFGLTHRVKLSRKRALAKYLRLATSLTADRAPVRRRNLPASGSPEWRWFPRVVRSWTVPM
jgi:rhodanese-related sulfurtransferase